VGNIFLERFFAGDFLAEDALVAVFWTLFLPAFDVFT
jgi:hypothetical protein